MTRELSALGHQINLFPDVSSQLTSFQDICSKLEVQLGPAWPDRFGKATHKWAKNAISTPIRTLSLFSGGGGLDIAFHDAGFTITTMVEIEEKFVATLRANTGKGEAFRDVDILHKDIREFWPCKSDQIDFIIGGPPCQTFSAAGRRAEGVAGVSDDRGTLFEEYVRILKEISPKGFLFENVYGITGAEGGGPWDEIKQKFDSAGYHIFYRILDSADFGVPQHRERLFIIGTKEGEFWFPRPTHGPDSPGQFPFFTASQAVDGTPSRPDIVTEGIKGRYGHLLEEIPPGLNYSFFTEKMGHPHPIFAWRSKFSDFLYKADPETPVRTIKAQGGQYTGPFHWDSRNFTVSELKRLQTIPDEFKILGGRGSEIHQIGNSVPPHLGRILALAILNQIFDIQLPFELSVLAYSETLGFRKRKRALSRVYKEKAKAALEGSKPRKKKEEPLACKYQACLTEDFGWIEAPDQSGTLYVAFEISTPEEWRIIVGSEPAFNNHKFIVTVTPSPRMQWGLGVKRAVILGSAIEPEIYSAGWKAFEAELIKAGIKADLVQLSGYYQYPSMIQCHMKFETRGMIDERWRVVQAVLSGIGVAQTLSTTDLAQLWNVVPERILSLASFLRSLGYEARNHNTNPQIPKGHFLIPYAFPTLTPLSVQLRKSLTG